MDIQLSEHFDNRKLLRFSLPSIVMMIFTSITALWTEFMFPISLVIPRSLPSHLQKQER